MARFKIVESVEHNRINRVHEYEDLGIHHPTANARGMRTGRAEDFQRGRPHQKVDGEFEEVRNTSDGRTLVKKDFILSHDGKGPVLIPSPVDGYVHFKRDAWATIGIYDKPFGQPGAKLLAQVLHMEPGSFHLKEGAQVAYGQPLGQMGDTGSPGIIHAHVEAEPAQFRRYIHDIDSGLIRPAFVNEHSHSIADGAATGIDVLQQGASGPGVRDLQQQLQRLGYTGRDGQPLRVDGDFGAHTEFAVRAFQRAHHLQVDGRAGPRQTLPAIDAAAQQLLTDPSHPRHALYAQALVKVHAEEARRHIAHGPHSERLAGAIAVAAMHASLTRIDRVELNTPGSLARAVQVSPVRDEPALNRMTAAVDTHAALRQSLQASSQQARDVLPLVPVPAMAMPAIGRAAP
jgi:hypothetical protein